jgi:membrane protein Man1
MSELENLSNDELRIELLKYGFANMPVTSTTRKVLLKKLKIAKETQKSKTRRETVAVMKASDDEEPIELARSKKERTPNRRATVGVVEKTKKVPATTTTQNGNDSPPKSQSRRSSRATPAKDKPIVSSSALSLQEQSDDDIIEIIEPPTISTRRSKSKTPTLAKSETVRTSTQYIRTVPIVREEDPSTEEDDRSYEVEFQEPQPVLQNRRTTTLSYSNKPTRNITPTKNIGKTLSTSYNPSYVKLDAGNDYEDDEDDQIEAPYLSNFAKRLSTLRAEPLDEGMKKYQKDSYSQPSTSYSTNYRYSSSQYSKPIASQKGYGDVLANKFDQMDRKYSVRKYVYICLIVMIAVAIYVIFFT